MLTQQAFSVDRKDKKQPCSQVLSLPRESTFLREREDPRNNFGASIMQSRELVISLNSRLRSKCIFISRGASSF